MSQVHVRPLGFERFMKLSDCPPRPAAQEESHLPVVDVEEQRPVPSQAREVADAGAGEPGLGGVEEVAVGHPGERGQPGREGREPTAGQRAHRDRLLRERLPDRGAEAGADDLHRPQGLEQAGQEPGAPDRVVRDVEAEDRDLHDDGWTDATASDW
jgi:hypothetical protein